MDLSSRIRAWCHAQHTDVEATHHLVGDAWRVYDWTTRALLARGTAIEVLRTLRGLRGYRQPLDRDALRAELARGGR